MASPTITSATNTKGTTAALVRWPVYFTAPRWEPLDTPQLDKRYWSDAPPAPFVMGHDPWRILRLLSKTAGRGDILEGGGPFNAVLWVISWVQLGTSLGADGI